MKRKLRVITNSEMQTRRRCAREHHFAYVLGYRTVAVEEALRVGAAIHVGLEAIWRGEPLETAFALAMADAEDSYEAAKLRVMLRGYVARWGDDHMDVVVGVEREFRAPLVNPETGAPSKTYELGGKIDVLLSNRFIEHKTTSQDIGLGSAYWKRLTLNSQVSTYYAGAKSLGVEVQECIYDVLKKPALRPRQVPLRDENGKKIVLNEAGKRIPTKDGKKWRETGDAQLGYTLQTRLETVEEYEERLVAEVSDHPDQYYQRGTVVRLEEEEKEAMQDAWQIARAMREDELAGRAPRNSDACERYGKMCPYFDVCCGHASLDDITRFVRVANVHQELSEESE
jgi:hypothetical protein